MTSSPTSACSKSTCALTRTRREPGAAVLGHIDWLQDLPPVGGHGLRLRRVEPAVRLRPHPQAERTSTTASSTRATSRCDAQFLVDAADDGVTFDPDFRYAAFEDSEYAYRLEKRGLELRYCADGARLSRPLRWTSTSFARREYRAGQMAVVFYRKHPQIDDQLQVRWIGDWADAVDRSPASRRSDARMRALDADTDTFVRSLAESLQELIEPSGEGHPRLPTAPKFADDCSGNGLLNVCCAWPSTSSGPAARSKNGIAGSRTGTKLRPPSD